MPSRTTSILTRQQGPNWSISNGGWSTFSARENVHVFARHRGLTCDALSAVQVDIATNAVGAGILKNLNDSEMYVQKFSPMFECVVRTDAGIVEPADVHDRHIIDGPSNSYVRALTYVGADQALYWVLIDRDAPNASFAGPTLMRVHAQAIRSSPKRPHLVVKNVIASFELNSNENSVLKHRPDSVGIGAPPPALYQ